MVKASILIIASILSTLLQGQTTEGLIAFYSFDDGTITDLSPNAGSNGIIIGEPLPACGVSGNALEFDGMDDNALLGGQIQRFFEANDFTLSFYFRVTDNLGTHDILSKLEMCGGDVPGFSISYTPSSRRINAAFIQDANNQVVFNNRLPEGSCFYHLMFLKNDQGISMYVNGSIIERIAADRLDIRNGAMLYIGNGPCVGVTDRRFAGVIDEFRLYNRVLTTSELSTLTLAPDRILTNDTTIVTGSSVNVRVNTLCTGNFNWSPTADVLDVGDPETVITPSQTRTYELEMIYPNCIATDTLLITVIDPSQVECGKVPIPNTFTPNGDGLNDIFFISNPFTLEELLSFEIFDRWGNQMFSTVGKTEGWDGNYQGQPVEPGPYLYRIRYLCQGNEQEKSGSVLLIR